MKSQNPSLSIFLILILVVTASSVLSSCSTDSRNEKEIQNKNEPPTFVVVIVSGYDSDPTPAQIEGTSQRGQGNSGMFQLKCDLEKSGLECKFFNWNGSAAGQISQNQPPGADAIASWMKQRVARDDSTRFVCIGHSWGGHTLIDVASKLKDHDSMSIPLTLLLDASSAMRGSRPSQMPDRIDRVVNYHTGNMFCWGKLKNANLVENVNLGDPENGFMVDGFPHYQSKFDIDAHNAAEWDQKIHSDMKRRILGFTRASDRSK